MTCTRGHGLGAAEMMLASASHVVHKHAAALTQAHLTSLPPAHLLERND
jgi:hypothetical protein